MDGSNPGPLGDRQAFPPGSAKRTRDNERRGYGSHDDLELDVLV